MAFFSWQFVLFLAVSLAVYYIVPVRFQWIVLLVSSAWYYVVGGGLKACIYVLVTVVTTYAGAVLMDNMQRKVDEKLKAKGENAPKLSREEKKQLKAAGQKKETGPGAGTSDQFRDPDRPQVRQFHYHQYERPL